MAILHASDPSASVEEFKIDQPVTDEHIEKICAVLFEVLPTPSNYDLMRLVDDLDDDYELSHAQKLMCILQAAARIELPSNPVEKHT